MKCLEVYASFENNYGVYLLPTIKLIKSFGNRYGSFSIVFYWLIGCLQLAIQFEQEVKNGKLVWKLKK